MLFQGDFLGRAALPLPRGGPAYLYYLQRNGAEAVAEELGVEMADLDWSPRYRPPTTRKHLIATNDIRIAMQLAVKHQGFVLESWIDDLSLRRSHSGVKVTIVGPDGGTVTTSVVPDGYGRLRAGENWYPFFIEADMATETGEALVFGNKDFARKIVAYLEFYRSGQYSARYQAKSYRVLTVTTSQKRLENLMEVTERAGGKRRFWFTTFDMLNRETVLSQPIWRVATEEGQFRFL